MLTLEPDGILIYRMEKLMRLQSQMNVSFERLRKGGFRFVKSYDNSTILSRSMVSE